MSLDLAILGNKLSRYRQQFQATLVFVSQNTGIPVQILSLYEEGQREPSGDHILILADFYKCDYRFFLSNEKFAPFEQTETLFRKHGGELSADDRWAIQEFLFLCECEESLMGMLHSGNRTPPPFKKVGRFLKQQGIDAAAALRAHLGYQANQIPINVFADLRAIGLHVFRRSLSNSTISGLFVRHPFAGLCILVNYSEDMYRQRFTVAHEAGHALLDDEKDINMSFTAEDRRDLSEVRANTFASHYLMPKASLRAIPEPQLWTAAKLILWASRLSVSTTALSIALKDAGLLDEATAKQLRGAIVPRDDKVDPELHPNLSQASRSRKSDMLKRGLSSFYVDLCFQAFRQGDVSSGRLAEMLLISPHELDAVAKLYGEESIQYGT